MTTEQKYIEYVEAKIEIDEMPYTFAQWLEAEAAFAEHA